MIKRYAWSRKSDDEIWRSGPCDSIKECVDEALEEDFKMDDTLALGLIEEYKIGTAFADIIIEYLQQDAYDEVGEVSEDWLNDVTKDQRDLLDNLLQKSVLAWLSTINEKPTFYKVLPCEECTLKEALEIHNSKTKGGKLNK